MSRNEKREGSQSSKTRRVQHFYKGHKATGRLELETYRFYRHRSARGIERGSLAAEWGRGNNWKTDVVSEAVSTSEGGEQINTNQRRLCWCYCFNVCLSYLKQDDASISNQIHCKGLSLHSTWILITILTWYVSLRTYRRDLLQNRPIRLLQSCSACLRTDSAYNPWGGLDSHSLALRYQTMISQGDKAIFQ